MSVFKYEDQYRAYITRIDDVLVCCREVQTDYGQKAQEYVKAYKERLQSLSEYIYEEISPIYGEMPLGDLMCALGTPMIDMDRGIISYLATSLDSEHIIEVEFGGILDKFFRVSVDG